MQIGNNRPDGPKPQKQLGPGLDPDLTKANREGIASTTRTTRAQTQDAIEARTPAKAAEARKAVDSFVRSKPEEDPGPDVSQRIKNARNQTRIGNARAQDAEAGEGSDKAQRIANARAQHADNQAQRIAQARAQAANSPATAGDQSQRIENARGQERIENARGQERIKNARDQAGDVAKSQRIENARAQYRENSQVDSAKPSRAVRSAKLSSGSIDLPGLRGDLPGVSGARESSGARAERVESLRQAHQAGELNTPDRARAAAGRLLAGE